MTDTMTPAGAANATPGAPLALKPFVRGATEYTEQFMDQTLALGAGSKLFSVADVPAFGFMAHLVIEVTATGGAAGAATVAAQPDAPFSVLSQVNLRDVSGANIVGPIEGFELLQANIWGAYVGKPDARDQPDYSAVTSAGNFTFRYRAPVQVSGRDGLGALPNLSASATYKLSVEMAPSSAVYATAPDTLPNVRVRAWLEAWSAVNAVDEKGQPQAQQPPAVGTTQFWTRQVFSVAAGEVQLRLNRVGNLHRTHILIGRTTAGARSNTVLPDPVRLTWDSRPLYNETAAYRRQLMRERQRATGQALDTGVLVFDWSHELDSIVGDEIRDQWLSTLQSSRLEYSGTLAAAGTITILTNDVAAVGNPYIG